MRRKKFWKVEGEIVGFVENRVLISANARNVPGYMRTGRGQKVEVRFLPCTCRECAEEK